MVNTRVIFQAVSRAAAANWHISLALGAVALSIILGYEFVPAVRASLEVVADWKAHYGFRFSFISTAIFGGVFPLLVEQFRDKPSRRFVWPTVLFMVIFWGLRGMEIDLLYRVQAWVFGDSSHWRVVVAKVAADMLIYAPLWATPTTILLYHWQEKGFRAGVAYHTLGHGWIVRRILPVQIANWSVWIPAVTVIYMLPLPLQLPIQNVILLMFAVILLFMTREEQIPVDVESEQNHRDAETQRKAI